MDVLQEIWATLMQNKFRTVLTGFSIAWGIFILIILLAASTGLKNGIMGNFGSRQINSISTWAGRTSMPYQGIKTNRQLSFSDKEIETLRQLPEVELISKIDNKYGLTANNQLDNTSVTLRGVEGPYAYISGIRLNAGRFINEMDLQQKTKVAVIDDRTCEILFKGNTNVLGEQITIAGINYTIVGITQKENNWGGETIYTPFTTLQGIYKPSKKFNDVVFTLKGLDTPEANQAFEEKLRTLFAQSMLFDKNDLRAVGFWNTLQGYLQTVTITNALTLFVLLIGILTLVSGAVGVSNIMIVSVQERTREIGIRKALGAQPRSIILAIVGESLCITIVFGYIGMLLGIAVVEIISNTLSVESTAMNTSIFKDPSVDLFYVFIANVILIISGVIAGYMPAYKAAKIKPIEAMRRE